MSQARGILGMTMWAALLTALGFANWQASVIPIETAAIAAPNGAAAPTLESLENSPKLGESKVAIADLSQTLARPLFNANRRPRTTEAAIAKATEASAPPPPQATPPPAQLHLIGMMRNGSSKARALIRVENAPTAKWIDIGDEIAGWRLSEVNADHVVVEGSGQRVQLVLYPDKTR